MSDLTRYDKKFKLAKARFHRIAKHKPLYPDIHTLSNAVISRVASRPAIAAKLEDETFRLWFMEEKFEKDMLQAGAQYAIERLIDIVTASEVGPKADITSANQVAAAKILLDMGGFSPQKATKSEYKDREIGDLDEDQLTEYIRKRTKPIEDS